MAKIRTFQFLGACALLLSLLAGCGRGGPVVTATPVRPAVTLVEADTPYPGPVEGQSVSTEGAYPSPLEPSPDSGYPAPATPLAAYPQPQTAATASPAATVTASAAPATLAAQATATVGEAYPGPDVPSISSQSTSYPAPGSATPGVGQPSATPTGQATGTQTTARTATATVAGTPSGTTAPALTPTVTPTSPLVRTSQQVTDPSSFQLAAGRPQLVEFFAVWSPLSNSMAPVMNNLEERYNERILFTFLDIDDPANSLFKTLLGERVPPVFYLLDADGNYLDEWHGYVAIEEFETAFGLLP